MLLSVIPRVEVLAELTGLGDEVEDPPVDAVVEVEPEGDDDPQAAATTSTAPTTASARADHRRDEPPTEPVSRPRRSHHFVAPMYVAPCRPHPVGMHLAGRLAWPNPIEPSGYPQPGTPRSAGFGPA